MKTLISLVVLAFSSMTFANGQNFNLCSPSDRNFLASGAVRGNEAVIKLIKEEVMENEVSCVVSRPELAFPAVCGTAILQQATFVINTKTGGTYTIMVEASYRSCTRIRVIPMVKSLTYVPTPKPVYFP